MEANFLSCLGYQSHASNVPLKIHAGTLVAGVPGTVSFLPFGAIIFLCFRPVMYHHPEFSKVRTIAETSLLLLCRMLQGRIGPIS